VFQGSVRWQTFVALSVVGNMLGDFGLATASVAMVAMIPVINVMSVSVLAHFASPEPNRCAPRSRDRAQSVHLGLPDRHRRQPLRHRGAAAALRVRRLARALVAGIGLLWSGRLATRRLRRPNRAALVTVFLKLIVMPVIAITLGVALGLSGASLTVVACCASVPAASNAYVLARQMGGDAPLLAQILVLQTMLAALTMPLFIAPAG